MVVVEITNWRHGVCRIRPSWQYLPECIMYSGCIISSHAFFQRCDSCFDKRCDLYTAELFFLHKRNYIIIITWKHTQKKMGRNIHGQTLKIFLQRDNAQHNDTSTPSSCHKWFKWVQNSLTVLSRVTVQEHHGNPAVGERGGRDHW